VSVRLGHRGARLVVPLPRRGGEVRWLALHRRPVPWDALFTPVLGLLGVRSCFLHGCLLFSTQPCKKQDLTPEEGRISWTRGPFWTTIRVQLPPCSAKKAALIASALLKAARYAEVSGA
jgi:hypothetical protein